MKKQFFSLCLVATTFLFNASCSKSNPNAAFLGTYYGTSTQTGSILVGGDTVTVTAGASSNQIVILDVNGNGSLSLNASVSGTSVSIPAQSVTFGSATSSVSGTGTLSGSTLTLNENFQGQQYPIVFTGTR